MKLVSIFFCFLLVLAGCADETPPGDIHGTLVTVAEDKNAPGHYDGIYEEVTSIGTRHFKISVSKNDAPKKWVWPCKTSGNLALYCTYYSDRP